MLSILPTQTNAIAPAVVRGAFADRPALRLSSETRSELELLMNGALHPVCGFLDHEDWSSVENGMRLKNGHPFPLPLALEIQDVLARRLQPGQALSLRDDEGFALASVRVRNVWVDSGGTWRTGGSLIEVNPQPEFDLRDFRLEPARIRAFLASSGRTCGLAASPGALLHPDRKRALFRLADEFDAAVVFMPWLHSAIAPRLDPLTRLRSMQASLSAEERRRSTFAAIPLRRRMRRMPSLLLRGVLASNCGCSHVDMVDDSSLGPWAADKMYLAAVGKELGVAWVQAASESPTLLSFVDTFADEEVLARALVDGRRLTPGILPEESLTILRRRYPVRQAQGFTVFLTGLSGAGKSTIAKALKARLDARDDRQVTLLDGDVVRTQLSSELGFSREHRDLNVRRIGFVAAEITRHRGVAICAPIAPYESTRTAVKESIEAHGGFVLVHVATPLEVCEARDAKGLYAKARAGELPTFTGVSDPYEAPQQPSLTIDGSVGSPEQAAERIVQHLVRDGYLQSAS